MCLPYYKVFPQNSLQMNSANRDKNTLPVCMILHKYDFIYITNDNKCLYYTSTCLKSIAIYYAIWWPFNVIMIEWYKQNYMYLQFSMKLMMNGHTFILKKTKLCSGGFRIHFGLSFYNFWIFWVSFMQLFLQ